MAYISSYPAKTTSRRILTLLQSPALTSNRRRNPILTPALFSLHFLHGFPADPSPGPLSPHPSPAVDKEPLPVEAPVEQIPPTSTASSDVTLPTSDQETKVPPRTPRGKKQSPERLDETICYMMAKRPWTTRLQNSIRSLSPQFDQPLVLGVLRGARTPEHALQFFRWVEKTGFRHDRWTYLEIIRILTRADMLNHARCILIDDMPKREVDREEEMFVALIEGYGKAGIPQEVVKIFRRMPELGVERSIKSYDAFYKAILRSGRAMMAKRVFNAMLRDGIFPTLYTYNVMIWGFCLSQMMQTANRFFGDMKDRGIVPDVVTYNTLIGGLARSKKMEDAQKLYAEMSGLGLVPNSITYTVMIKGYVASGMVDDGLQVFAEMSTNGIQPNEQTYSALLPGLCDDAEKAVKARNLLNEMAERHISPKDKSIFLSLIICLCKSGDLNGALEVLRSMNGFRVTANTSHYGILIESLCKEKMYNRAVEMLDEVLDKGMLLSPHSSSMMEASTYNPLIEYLCYNGYTKKAEALFRQLMKKGIDDSTAFNHLISGHSKEGEPESALGLLAIMNRHGVASDCDAYALLVESFLKKGEPAEAKTALDSMLEQGHLPGASLFRMVMEGLLDDNRVQTASRVMKSMVEKGVKENMDVVHKILEALLVRGHVEEALGRINLLMVNDCIPNFDSLLVALCDKDKTIAALKLMDFGLERDCDISFSSYDRVLDALYSAGKTLNAYSILCKIKKKGGATNQKGCEDLIKSLIAEGNTKQADILSRLVFGDTGMKRGKKDRVDVL